MTPFHGQILHNLYIYLWLSINIKRGDKFKIDLIDLLKDQFLRWL